MQESDDTLPLAVLTPGFRREDARGVFAELLNGGGWQAILHGQMRPEAELGNHYHQECRACFHLLSGEAEVWVRHAEETPVRYGRLTEGEGVFFEVYETHLIRFCTEASFLLLKDRVFDPDHPDLHHCPVWPDGETGEDRSSG